MGGSEGRREERREGKDDKTRRRGREGESSKRLRC